jgi:hypothetical protein
VGDLCAVLLVNNQATSLVGLKADVIEAEAIGIRAATDSDEDNIGIKLRLLAKTNRLCSESTYSLLFATLGSFNINRNTSGVNLSGGDLCVELELQALLLEELLRLFGDFVVHARAANLAQELDNGNLASETRPDGGLGMLEKSRDVLQVTYHLETNDTTTDDGHLLRNLLKRNGSSAGDDLLLVNGQAGEGRRLRTSGNEDVLRANSGLATVNKVDSDGVFVLESAGALDVFNVVLLEEKLDSLGQASDRSVLRLHHGWEVELDVTDFDTAALCVVQDLVIEVRVVQERL